jgi:hypothetical protein
LWSFLKDLPGVVLADFTGGFFRVFSGDEKKDAPFPERPSVAFQAG